MNAVEAKAREILSANGEPNPHPALLEDTMREVEYHGLVAETPVETPAATETADVWTVEKNEYEVPCEHPLCEQLHQRFMTTQTFEGWTSGLGVAVWATQTVRSHDRNVSEWVVLCNGTREGRAGMFEAFDTKREALAALRSRGLI